MAPDYYDLENFKIVDFVVPILFNSRFGVLKVVINLSYVRCKVF